MWLALAALLHPLMAGYAAIAMVTLALARHRKWRSLGLLCGLGWLLCAVIFMVTRHADPTVALTAQPLAVPIFSSPAGGGMNIPGL